MWVIYTLILYGSTALNITTFAELYNTDCKHDMQVIIHTCTGTFNSHTYKLPCSLVIIVCYKYSLYTLVYVNK